MLKSRETALKFQAPMSLAALAAASTLATAQRLRVRVPQRVHHLSDEHYTPRPTVVSQPRILQ